MAVTLGTRLGRYEIVSLIGAGGMGEASLTLDAQLDRNVALKILPPDVTSNGERMRRFVQQAKAAAALSHPKPDNVIITRDGYTKTLDFRLAKLIEPRKGSDGGSGEVATAILPQHSTPGTVMGWSVHVE